MSQTGTLAAYKQLFSAYESTTDNTFITSTFNGRAVGVNTNVGNRTMTMGIQAGDAAGGIAAFGETFAVIFLKLAAGNTLNIAFSGGDTYNGGQAGPIALGAQNDWAIVMSQGAAAAPGDWIVFTN